MLLDRQSQIDPATGLTSFKPLTHSSMSGHIVGLISHMLCIQLAAFSTTFSTKFVHYPHLKATMQKSHLTKSSFQFHGHSVGVSLRHEFGGPEVYCLRALKGMFSSCQQVAPQLLMGHCRCNGGCTFQWFTIVCTEKMGRLSCIRLFFSNYDINFTKNTTG